MDALLGMNKCFIMKNVNYYVKRRDIGSYGTEFKNSRTFMILLGALSAS